MTVALVSNGFNKEKLEAVKKEMALLGAPVISAVWMEVYNCFAAMEGCHRIRAAKELGLTPIIKEIEYSDEMASTISGYDGDEDYPISELCDVAHRSVMLEF